MPANVIVDAAGGPKGGFARYRQEMYRYLDRSGRHDITVIGSRRRLGPAWLLRREMACTTRGRKVAINNVGFVSPGGSRWTLIANALHFLTDTESDRLESALRAEVCRQAIVVRFAARRSDVVVVPCTAMADRVATTLPDIQRRLVVRMHPVSDMIPRQPTDPVLMCPMISASYKRTADRLTEWVRAADGHFDPSVRLLVTTAPGNVPPHLAGNPRLEFVGELSHRELTVLWARARAVYFPSGLESFGFPLAEARVHGQSVVALDTAQNREIAGGALCGFTAGDIDSLRQATELALTNEVAPDPGPFDPDKYFDWLLAAD